MAYPGRRYAVADFARRRDRAIRERWPSTCSTRCRGRCGAPTTWSGSRSSRCCRAATSSSRAFPARARRCSPSRSPTRSAAVSGGSSARPTCCPADVTGTSVYSPATGDWEFRAGPVFANVLLVDEVNRASPRTQAALLEPMEEHQVTIDGVTHPLPVPFFLVATENPFGHAGTFPLPDSQLDRFAMVCTIGRPGPRSRAPDPERRRRRRRARRHRAGHHARRARAVDGRGSPRALRALGARLRARRRRRHPQPSRRRARRVAAREPQLVARRAGARDGDGSRLRLARRRQGGRAPRRSRIASCSRAASTSPAGARVDHEIVERVAAPHGVTSRAVDRGPRDPTPDVAAPGAALRGNARPGIRARATSRSRRSCCSRSARTAWPRARRPAKKRSSRSGCSRSRCS